MHLLRTCKFNYSILENITIKIIVEHRVLKELVLIYSKKFLKIESLFDPVTSNLYMNVLIIKLIDIE